MKLRHIIKWTKWIFLSFLLFSIIQVIVLRFIPVKYPANIVWYSLGKKLQGKEATYHHRWIPKEEMPDTVRMVAVAAEDIFFMKHHGFDFFQIMVAIAESKEGKPLRGASTISQQTAKNVFLWHGRSYFRKLLEAYYTILIELIWGKERILEVYLNVVQTGKNTFGIAAISENHFHKPAKDLNSNEAAWIITILPNPVLYDLSNPSESLQERQKIIIQRIPCFDPTTLKLNENVLDR